MGKFDGCEVDTATVVNDDDDRHVSRFRRDLDLNRDHSVDGQRWGVPVTGLDSRFIFL